MPYQLRDPFSTEETDTTETGSGVLADVIPMYREAATPPNMTPVPAPAYQAAPPPIEVPYGWRMVQTPGGWLMTHEPAEWSVIARCVEGRRDGIPLDAIAATLADEDAPIWNSGRRDYGVVARWHPERVRRLVQRYAPDLHAAPRPRGGKKRPEAQPAARDLSYKDDLEELLALAAINDRL